MQESAPLRLICLPKIKTSLIHSFVFLNKQEEGTVIYDKHIPDGYSILVINFRTTAYCYYENQEILLPPYFLITPLKKTLFVKIISPLETMGMILHTSQATRLFDLDLAKIGHLPFKSAGSFFPEKLYAELREAGENNVRQAIFEEFISEKLKTVRCAGDEIDKLFDIIVRSKGSIPLHSVLPGIRMPERTFRRKFLSRTGMNAKSLCRIVRLQSIWSEFLKKEQADMQSLAFNAGFYDQSHLINELKEFIGESPKEFFHRDQQSMKLISWKLD